MILDITAGNRHIWGGWAPPLERTEPILFFDVEAGLKIPPDVICDNRHLPVRDGVADSVVFDPPHVSFGTSPLFGDPQEKLGSFWGNYKNLRTLRRLLVGGMKTARRVLRPSGHLYFKWSTSEHPLERFLPFFTRDFEEVDRIERPSRAAKNKKSKSYWVTFRLR